MIYEKTELEKQYKCGVEIRSDTTTEPFTIAVFEHKEQLTDEVAAAQLEELHWYADGFSKAKQMYTPQTYSEDWFIYMIKELIKLAGPLKQDDIEMFFGNPQELLVATDDKGIATLDKIIDVRLEKAPGIVRDDTGRFHLAEE